MITAAKMKRIHSRPGRPAGGFEEGPHLTRDDEKILDRVSTEIAAEDGVEQIPNQPSREEIKRFRP